MEDQLPIGVPDPRDVEADQEGRILVGVVMVVVDVVEHQSAVIDLDLSGHRRGP
jgi:hypothetical protein